MNTVIVLAQTHAMWADFCKQHGLQPVTSSTAVDSDGRRFRLASRYAHTMGLTGYDWVGLGAWQFFWGSGEVATFTHMARVLDAKELDPATLTPKDPS